MKYAVSRILPLQHRALSRKKKWRNNLVLKLLLPFHFGRYKGYPYT
jgi:hypothetical protein